MCPVCRNARPYLAPMSEQPGQHVLMIDSGMGGLSVARAVCALMPGVRLSYIADTAAFPYGDWQEDALSARVLHLAESAFSKARFDAVVIACNTASTLVMEALRARWPTPFIGVVPPIKTAAEQSRSRVIGLLATAGTVRRPYIDTLIQRFAADCTIIRIGSPDLATMAEDKIRGVALNGHELQTIIQPFLTPAAKGLDAVVLGCTHYPLILDELKARFQPDMLWLDPAPAVARRLADLMTHHPVQHDAAALAHTFFFTGSEPGPAHAYLRGMGFQTITHWPGLDHGR